MSGLTRSFPIWLKGWRVRAIEVTVYLESLRRWLDPLVSLGVSRSFLHQNQTGLQRELCIRRWDSSLAERDQLYVFQWEVVQNRHQYEGRKALPLLRRNHPPQALGEVPKRILATFILVGWGIIL